NRSGAPGTTSASCSTAARPPRTCWRPSPASSRGGCTPRAVPHRLPGWWAYRAAWTAAARATGGLRRTVRPPGPDARFGRGEPRAAGHAGAVSLGNHVVEEEGMATRDTGGQSQTGRSRRDAEIEDTQAPEVDPEISERVEKVSEEVDDILDEIDSVLEENAEEFIRGYVQKGGQ